jgi:hypothetical protein
LYSPAAPARRVEATDYFQKKKISWPSRISTSPRGTTTAAKGWAAMAMRMWKAKA